MQLLTTKEVADRCRMSEEWVETAISVGLIPVPICLDGHKRWQDKDIDKWMEAGCPSVRPPEELPPNNLAGDANLNLATSERRAIEEALRINNGNCEETARLLGIGERTLYRRIRDYKLG